MIILFTLLTFLIGGCLPFIGHILIKRLPSDLGSFVVLIFKDIKKKPFSFSLRYAMMSFLIFSFFIVSETLAFSLPVYLFLSLALSLLIYTDETDFLLPDAFTLAIFVLGIYLAMGSFDQLLTAIHGIFWGFALSLFMGFTSTIKKPDSFGGGDMKLLMAFGAFVGPMGLSFLVLCSLPFFLIDFFLRGKKRFVPYGPSLIIAFLITLLFSKSGASLTFF